MGNQCSSCVENVSAAAAGDEIEVYQIAAGVSNSQISQNGNLGKEKKTDIKTYAIEEQSTAAASREGSRTEEGRAAGVELRAPVELEPGVVYHGEWCGSFREGKGILT
eukprot:Trichotokara_eunicae@DN9000_c0_g1_i2.p1